MSDSNITKKALAQALKDLMNEKPFSKISVGNICALYNMNRKSFYYHFKDKYDLLNWIFYTEFVEILRDEKSADGWDVLERICTYFYENRPFYQKAFKIGGQDSFRDYLKEFIHIFLTAYFPQEEQTKDPEFFNELLDELLIIAIEKWLDHQDWEPEDFVRQFRHFLYYTSSRFVDLNAEDEEGADSGDSGLTTTIFERLK